jgi:anti-sigma factor RsiW
MTCVELLRTQAFVDGELDGAASTDAEQHLQSCAECQAFVASAAIAGDLIRRDAVRYHAPVGLRQNILKSLDTPRIAAPRGFWLGAGSGAGAMALAAGLALFFLLPPSAASLSQALVDDHVGALMQHREIAVVSSNHHTVKPWFAGRVAVSPPVADFVAEGFTLAGGRVDRVAGRDMAVVVYRHGAHEMDLYVWAGGSAPLPGAGMRHGYRLTSWKSADLDFAAVSDVDSVEFEKFVALVRNGTE